MKKGKLRKIRNPTVVCLPVCDFGSRTHNRGLGRVTTAPIYEISHDRGTSHVLGLSLFEYDPYAHGTTHVSIHI